MAEKSSRIYTLDLIKFLASIMIVFHHYQQVRGLYSDSVFDFYGGPINFGYLVELFFMISGFVCENKFSYNMTQTLGGFMKKKVKRIYPMVAISVSVYAIFLVAGYFVFGSYYNGNSLGLWQIASSMLLIFQGGAVSLDTTGVNNPIWYLCVLLICYAVYQTILALARRFKFNPVYLYIAMVFAGIGITDFSVNMPFANRYSARGYMAFFIGVLLFRLNKNHQGLCRLIKNLTLPIFAVMSAAAIFLDKFFDNMCYIAVFIVFPLGLIFCLNSAIVNKLLNKRCFRTLGGISFEIYLWHGPLMCLSSLICGILGIEFTYSLVSMLIFTAITVALSIPMFMLENSIAKRVNDIKLQ